MRSNLRRRVLRVHKQHKLQHQHRRLQDPRVKTIQFESKLVGKTLPYNVLLPVDYDQPASKAKRYPVVYLLHGLTGALRQLVRPEQTG